MRPIRAADLMPGLPEVYLGDIDCHGIVAVRGNDGEEVDADMACDSECSQVAQNLVGVVRYGSPTDDYLRAVAAGTTEGEAQPLRYEPNPKHKEPWQRGARGSICPPDADGHALLAASQVDPKHPGKRYRWPCGHEHSPGCWHGFPGPKWQHGGECRQRIVRTS